MIPTAPKGIPDADPAIIPISKIKEYPFAGPGGWCGKMVNMISPSSILRTEIMIDRDPNIGLWVSIYNYAPNGDAEE